jgi:N-dimethylarginine dimethylaminohydrolase
MTYSVHQHWDPLRVCVVGRSYPPEFYNFITNSSVRSVMERIAIETEEDYQKLIKLLESFGVEIVRPEINPDFSVYLNNGKYSPPPMYPCDWSIMVGDRFYHNWRTELQVYKDVSAEHWPQINSIEEFKNLPQNMIDEVYACIKKETVLNSRDYQHIINEIRQQDNAIIERPWRESESILNRAMVTRVGKDLYFGTDRYDQNQPALKQQVENLFPNYRCHIINTGGHSDGTFCPVVPGLIVSLHDIPSYTESFPGWEVIYLPGQSWAAVKSFLDLKVKNKGKWWVPGEELNNDFTEFVEGWLSHWVGYVEETVFDVNMLVIDEKNVVCNNYNEKVFEAFSRYGVTPHVVNFRHRYFWDGGLHCITSDLHREGVQKDYFPERGLT